MHVPVRLDVATRRIGRKLNLEYFSSCLFAFSPIRLESKGDLGLGSLEPSSLRLVWLFE